MLSRIGRLSSSDSHSVTELQIFNRRQSLITAHTGPMHVIKPLVLKSDPGTFA